MIPPISITTQTMETCTIKNAIHQHLGINCIHDIDSIYITNTKMIYYITFKQIELNETIKKFIKELNGFVSIKYNHHTFIAVSNIYDL